jgi:hypothetical protein
MQKRHVRAFSQVLVPAMRAVARHRDDLYVFAAFRKSTAVSNCGSGLGPSPKTDAVRSGVVQSPYKRTGICCWSVCAVAESVSLRRKSEVASGPMPPMTPSQPGGNCGEVLDDVIFCEWGIALPYWLDY